MFFKNKNWLSGYLEDQHLIKRPKSLWRKLWWPLVLLSLILIVILAPLVVNGWELYSRLKILDQKVGQIMSDAAGSRLGQLDDDLAGVQTDLVFIADRSQHLGLIGYLPPIHKTVLAGGQLSNAVIDLLSGYRQLLSVFGTLSLSTQEGSVVANLSTPDGRKAFLESIASNRQIFEQAKAKIQAAKIELANVNINDLNGIFKTKVTAANTLLNELVDQSETALPIFKYLPEIAGLGQERHYLILFENNMELRPTGGFIGSYGLVTVKDGEITDLKTDDIYNLDKLSKDKLQVPAPWPMTVYNGQKYLFLRDANWSPDWPTSAQQINWFWNAERTNAGLPPVPLDGIITITPDFIANFLGVTGPITVDGVTFNKDNFAWELEKQVEFNYAQEGIALQNRKDIIGDLTKELMSRLLKSPTQNLLQIWQALKKNITEKQILVYMVNPEIQSYFASMNWSGQMNDTGGDYFYAVDANLAGLKTDSVMKRSINYSVTVAANGDLLAHAEITYQHTGKPVKDLITTYRTFTRVYVPSGSSFSQVAIKDETGTKILDLTKDVEIKGELNHTYAGTFFTVEPGKSRTLILDYRLPANIKQLYVDGLYKLVVQKQPGTPGHKLQIDLKFNRLMTAYNSQVFPAKVNGQELWFSTDLTVDREVTVKF